MTTRPRAEAAWKVAIWATAGALVVVSLLPWFSRLPGGARVPQPNAWLTSPLWATVPLRGILGVVLWQSRRLGKRLGTSACLAAVGALALWAEQMIRYRSPINWADTTHMFVGMAYGTAADEDSSRIAYVHKAISYVRWTRPDHWSFNPNYDVSPGEKGVANASLSIWAWTSGVLLLTLALLLLAHRRRASASAPDATPH